MLALCEIETQHKQLEDETCYIWPRLFKRWIALVVVVVVVAATRKRVWRPKRINRSETQTSPIYRVSRRRWAAAFLFSRRTASSVSRVFSKCRTPFRVVLFQTCLSAASCSHSFTLIPHFSKECFSKSLCLFFGAPTDLVPWESCE